MGSLMSGWDSPVGDPNSVLKRNKSLTKEEIEAFWRIKKKTEEEHLEAISKLNIHNEEDVEEEEPAKNKVQRASEIPSDSNGWWRKSNWAFLNEPLPESRPNSYVSQFDVAQMAKSHVNNNAISA